MSNAQSTADGSLNEQIALSFPLKHWLVILAAIEQMNETSKRMIRDAIASKAEPATLDSNATLLMAGPMLIRGVIVKELAARGVMTAEADEQLGIDRIMEFVGKPQA
jgi:hypothetical protein